MIMLCTAATSTATRTRWLRKCHGTTIAEIAAERQPLSLHTTFVSSLQQAALLPPGLAGGRGPQHAGPRFIHHAAAANHCAPSTCSDRSDHDRPSAHHRMRDGQGVGRRRRRLLQWWPP